MTENWWETDEGKLELRKMIDEQLKKFPLVNADEVEYQFWKATQGQLDYLRNYKIHYPDKAKGSE